MFTGDVVMYDDSNLNKNEFTALVSFAVNFHIFHAQPLLSDLARHCGGGGRRRAAGFKGRGGPKKPKPAAKSRLPGWSSHGSFWKNPPSLVYPEEGVVVGLLCSEKRGLPTGGQPGAGGACQCAE